MEEQEIVISKEETKEYEVEKEKDDEEWEKEEKTTDTEEMETHNDDDSSVKQIEHRQICIVLFDISVTVIG